MQVPKGTCSHKLENNKMHERVIRISLTDMHLSPFCDVMRGDYSICTGRRHQTSKALYSKYRLYDRGRGDGLGIAVSKVLRHTYV